MCAILIMQCEWCLVSQGRFEAHRADCAGQKRLATPCAKTPRATDTRTKGDLGLMGFKDISEGAPLFMAHCDCRREYIRSFLLSHPYP